MSEIPDEVGPGVTRRTVLRQAVAVSAAALAPVTWPGSASAHTPDTASVHGTVPVHQGTNIGVSLSRDRRTLAIDLGTVLWLLPADGGEAKAITSTVQDATRPDFGPNSDRLVFQSFRGGTYGIWTMRTDGADLRQWTSGPDDDQEPRLSPDGRTVVFASDRAGANNLWLLRLDDGSVGRLTTLAGLESMPAWSPEGDRVATVVDNTAIDIIDVATGTRTRAVRAPAGATLQGPSFSPDGTRLAYVRTTGTEAALLVDEDVISGDEDVFGFAPVWWSDDELLYTADGQIRRRKVSDGTLTTIPFTAVLTVSRPAYPPARRDLDSTSDRPARGLAGPVLSRDGGAVAFQAQNAIWVMPMGGTPRRVVGDGYFAADPDFYPDGTAIIYSSDRTGSAQLWRTALVDGASHQLTDGDGGHLRPRLSPDGALVAYQDAAGATWVMDLAARTTRQVTPALFGPGRATWSPDGAVLALAAVRPYGRRNLAGYNHILRVTLATGELRYTEVMPGRSISNRGNDGPVWTADGAALLTVIDGQPWAVPAGATGTPRRLADETADELSVAADGTVLYLSEGKLRLLRPGATVPETVKCPLNFRVAVSEPLVIRAGAVWDGAAETLRPRTDIVVRDGHIAGLVTRTAKTGVRVVDAPTLTAIPGLIDMHVHWHNRGRQWGDRQGRLLLSYGVTSVRGVADPAYDMLEVRESQQAGTRVGPRLFGTGEALDGGRVYYSAMRPITTAAQVGRELRRARALGYDLVKTYIRLPAELERLAAVGSHAAGLPVTTHYSYPSESYGLDGLEHVGGGNRLGYTQIASRIGRVYDDTVALKALSGSWITSTLLFAAVRYAHDTALLTDERTLTLMPATEYRILQDLVAASTAEPRATMLRSFLAGAVDALLRIHRRGGLVVAGTDSPIDTVALGLHQNLRAMVEHGFTPYEALRTATANAATALGRADELGTLAVGRRADLALVEGNPLADVATAAAVRQVVVAGRLYTREELLAPFRTIAPASASRSVTVLPALHDVAGDDEHWWHAHVVPDQCSC
ncbi:amidohydrolase family protein [Micromonospora rifamycinica]|uniref:amidohydrolase family protein n=1 Tax=Micromonospora rifamycinica TaxID=291594 RepID=UPI002E29ACC1|nr:amidohydrolase family protein [Micromonospora rifamycinica]